MATPSGPHAQMLQRAHAEQIDTLFGQWRRTTSSMLLGALILCVVMWGTAPHWFFALWLTAIAANQAWRRTLVRRYRIEAPQGSARERWGRRWSLGSTVAGALWGVAGVVLFVPGDPSHQALLIVCLFGVVLGGIDLTAVYRRSFYGFVPPVLVPVIVRVALERDQVHAFIAAVMLVVLAFILGFGHNLNNVLTQSLAIRYENVDLIGELQAQTAAAREARAAAEAANRAKTGFLAAASHDLRQPLHAMGLFAAALSAKVRDAEVQDMIASINASVEALEGLFNALMDISRLDAGIVAPRRAPFALGALLERIEQDHRPLAAESGLAFTVCATGAWVESDPVLVRRIVANLASNALRYTSRGGVVIGVRRRGAEWLLQVWDTGTGIAREERERIFEEFYQIGNPERNSSRGMGLGLSIVRRLSLLLGHRLELRSRCGRGSCFTLHLPRAEPRPSAERHPVPAAAAGAFAGRCIAVVDDEPAAIEGVRALFESCGASVVGAASGDALLDALGELGSYPDLLIADYRLGNGETGVDVIARVRDELGIALPAVLVSGDLCADALAAMRASTARTLLKPVAPAELKAVVESLLEPARETGAVPV